MCSTSDDTSASLAVAAAAVALRSVQRVRWSSAAGDRASARGVQRRPRSADAAARRPGAAPRRSRLGLTDGFGGNSWRLVTTASAKDEVAKCPSVTNFDYADGQGDTQKAISDIQGMVAKGVNAIVVFPDAGNAMLPALRSAYKAGVVTVPYRVNPGGEAGKDYDVWVGADFTDRRQELGRTGS